MMARSRQTRVETADCYVAALPEVGSEPYQPWQKVPLSSVRPTFVTTSPELGENSVKSCSRNSKEKPALIPPFAGSWRQGQLPFPLPRL
eukprot:s1109_g3.t1